MDVISHILIGEIIYLLSGAPTSSHFWIIFFAIVADIVHIPFYLVLGKDNDRKLCIAKNQDWEGASIKYKFLMGLYNTTHSIFFAFLIILPFILFFNLSKTAFIAYLSHIMVDIFSHKGEWSIKIFYPFGFKINGFSNAWIWPIDKMANFWFVFLTIIIFLKLFF